jgi:hypothetical protein
MRPFLQWFLLVLSYVSGAVFAARAGLFGLVWRGDASHISIVIAAIALAAVIHNGVATWRYCRGRSLSAVLADLSVGHAVAHSVTLLGLLGTVIGLMVQLSALAVLSPTAIGSHLAAVLSGMSTALFATGAGITACLLVTVVTINLEFFVTLEESDDDDPEFLA